MGFDKNIHRRKSIRLQGYLYSQQGAYFVTICTHQRQSLFGSVVDGVMTLNGVGEIVNTIWQELPRHYADIKLDEYVIMPNHFHGIVCINRAVEALLAAPEIQSSAPTLGAILRRFKSMSAIAVNRCLNQQGQHVWQRNYYEHIIRNEQAYQNIFEYIRTNPQKWHDDIYYT